ncbi:MAG: YfhL family 4Fe-4S dicluster ferredoxin [Anaerolineales bacterium]|nr:YfhL family 4Fe-4S dicluster ferredoxin [Anaerolineales bacterium]
MAYKISDDCLSCGVCEPECPNQAISMGDAHYEINPDRCTECVGFFDQPQCASVCPNEAIGPDPDRRESKEELLAKKNRLHP